MNLETRLHRLERQHAGLVNEPHPLTAEEAAVLPTPLLEEIVAVAHSVRTEGCVSHDQQARGNALWTEVQTYLDRWLPQHAGRSCHQVRQRGGRLR